MTTSALRRLLALAAALAAACTPENGPSMRPGSDCLACHGDGTGEDDGRPWFLAGTVYASRDGSGDGVRGATITVTDATGRTVTLHSQAVGNFYLADRLTFPLTVSVERNGVRYLMPPNAEFTHGSCNRCHNPGTEGSIYAP